VSTIAAKNRSLVDVVHTVSLETQVTAGAQTGRIMYLSTSGRTPPVVAGVRYSPCIVQVSDVVFDWGGSQAMTLLLAAPHSVWVQKVSDSTWEFFENLHAALQRYPAFMFRAQAKVYCALKADDGTITTYHLMTGRTRAMVNISTSTLTLTMDQADELGVRTIPKHLLKDLIPSQVDEKPDDLDLPGIISFGRWLPELPSGIVMDEWNRRNLLPALGIHTPMGTSVYVGTNVIPGANVSKIEDVLFCDDQSGGMLSAIPASPTHCVCMESERIRSRIYSGWYHSNGTYYPSMYDGIPTIDYSTAGNSMLIVGSTARPWIQVPIVPIDESNNATYSKAVDGKYTTYASLAASTGAIFKMPQGLSPPGRLAAQCTTPGGGTYDKESGVAPAGLLLGVLLVCPVGAPVDVSRNVVVQFTFPNGTVWCGAQELGAPPVAGSWKLLQAALPFANANVPGTAGAGWVGSRFHDFKFTTCIDDPNVKSGPDGSLYYLDSSGVIREWPFEIRVTNLTLYPVYIMGVALIAGCQFGVKVEGSAYGGYYSEMTRRDISSFRIRYALASFSSSGSPRSNVPVDPIIRGGRHVWDRGPGSASSRPREYQESIAPSRGVMRVASNIHQDDASGTYSGTPNAVLGDVLSTMRILVEKYAAADGSVVTGSGFGSYDEARALLNSWWDSGFYPPGNPWYADLQVSTETTIRDIVSSVSSVCMDLNVRKLSDGRYGFFSWDTADRISTYAPSRIYNSGEQSGLVAPLRQCVIAADGMAFNVSISDVDEIVSRLTVRYADGQCKATLDYNDAGVWSSDDGTGAAWGYGGFVPGTSTTAASLGQFASEFCKLHDGPYDRMTYIDVPWCNSARTAAMVGLYVICRKFRPEIRLVGTFNLSALDLRPGHVFQLDPGKMGTDMRWGPPLAASAGPLNVVAWGTMFWMAEQVDHVPSGEGIAHNVRAVCIPWTFTASLMSETFDAGGTQQEFFVPDQPEGPTAPSKPPKETEYVTGVEP
jgi:hypothetical protein